MSPNALNRVVAYALLSVLTLAAAGSTSAFEIELPGERRAQINGFYEMRLAFIGPDLPANGVTFSQFRHVLNLEAEVELFPDGVGPFDFMMLWSRWLVSYECIYERGCGLFPSANSYGGSRRSVDRAPRSLNHPRDGLGYVAGFIAPRYSPNTLRVQREHLNPAGAYRTIINGPGEINNPNGLGFLANFNDRSTIDEPHARLGVAAVRAGTWHNRAHLSLLQNLRAPLQARELTGPDGESTNASAVLTQKLLDNKFLQSVTNPNELATGARARQDQVKRYAARVTGYDSILARAKLAASGYEYSRTGTDPTLSVDQLAIRNSLIFGGGHNPASTEFSFPTAVNGEFTLDNAVFDQFALDERNYELYEYPDFEDRTTLNLLTAKPDPNFYEILGKIQAPELFEAQYAAQKRSQMGTTVYNATIDTPIRPMGYLPAEVLDYLKETNAGVSGDFEVIDTAFLQEELQFTGDLTAFRVNVVPGFTGPDGIFFTADDLPTASNGLVFEVFDYSTPNPFIDINTHSTQQLVTNALYNGVDGSNALRAYDGVLRAPGLVDGRFPGGQKKIFNARIDRDVVAAFRFNADHINVEGCRALGFSPENAVDTLGKLIPGTCKAGVGTVIEYGAATFEAGCKSARKNNLTGTGVNADGDCIELNMLRGAVGDGGNIGVHPRVILALADPSFRPDTAVLEPADATDYVNYARFGASLPARPRSPGNGLAGFGSPGLRRLIAKTSGLVSNLDLDFTEDELRWAHGASDDEHEFREGYLEFEMFDSQLWARVGKLLMVWGKTELQRNQDRLNPIDISNGVVTRLEEGRIGQWAAQVVLSPEFLMRVGPVEDLRLELALIFDDFERQDLGKCGEAGGIALVCGLGFGAYAHGISGIGVVGEIRPDKQYSGLKRTDFGVRLEGRWDRVTFAITDFWGWDDDFLIDRVYTYERSVDRNTGAPLRDGGTTCEYRTAGGGSSANVADSVGPDGNPATNADNLIPSAGGGCLLWEPAEAGDRTTIIDPSAPDRADKLRASNDIAFSHTVNQTLYHQICAFTFDPDTGYCAFDRLNNPNDFFLVSQAIGGVGFVADIVLRGVQTIRLTQNPGRQELRSTQFDILSPIVPDGALSNSGILALGFDPYQQALLGCGPAYGSACGSFDLNNTTLRAGFVSGCAKGGEVGDFFVDGDGVAHGDVTDSICFSKRADNSAIRALRPDLLNPLFFDLPAGIDFMNADGEVLTQEAAVIKALAVGHLIGTRDFELGTPYFEAGIKINDRPANLIDPAELASMNLAERAEFLAADAGVSVESYFGIEDVTVPGFGTVKRRSSSPQILRSDAWVEPLPWALDEEHLAQGEILYKIANQYERDPRCDATGRTLSDPAAFSDAEKAYCTNRLPFWNPAESAEFFIANDPTDPTNPLNVFITNPNDPDDDSYHLRVGEQCVSWILEGNSGRVSNTGFDEGCTKLETFSANLERFFSVLEIIGVDQFFDPPETVAEVIAKYDGNYTTNDRGDPISGPDGIFTLNARAFSQSQSDVQTVRNVTAATTFRHAGFDVSKDGNLGRQLGMGAEEFFETEFAPNQEAQCAGSNVCYLLVGTQQDVTQALGGKPLEFDDVAAWPIAFEVDVVAPIDHPAGDLLSGSVLYAVNDKVKVNLLQMQMFDPAAFSDLMAGGKTTVTFAYRQDDGNFVTLSGDFRMTAAGIQTLLNGGGAQGQDLNKEGGGSGVNFFDLDENQDGIADVLDDFTPGPVSDDNIFCGSGLPGDVLQDGIQVEYYSDAEIAKAEDLWGPGGIPHIRSPVYCNSISGILGATGQRLPFRRAGGDGSFGRRDFLWQSGQELALTYDKRNVFGFALDFAEDTTRSSWGIEFSWIANKRFANNLRPSGYSTSDEFVLSVSVDRPTFFNFLNPNRSFFINFQFFLRYLSDYDGGRDNHDGNYAAAPGPISGSVVLTAFTGYFQDRLSPRMTLLWIPQGNTGAALWGMGYRFSGQFTTSLSFTHFFGDAGEVQGAYNPIFLRGSPRQVGEGQSGTAAVRDEDQARLVMRYSW